MEYFGGDEICPDCHRQYLRLRSGECVQTYLQTHKMDYYRRWWFDSLPEQEQLEILQRSCHSQLTLGELEGDQLEFCLEQRDYFDHIQKSLR